MKTSSLLGLAAGAALLTATPVSLHWSATALPSLSPDRAEARVGRPLTPLSVAGVHRRAYRRGYGGWGPGVGLGVGAAALAAGAIATSPYYGYSGYSYPYSGSYGYSGYYPNAAYGAPYGYYGGPGYYRPRIGYGWRNW